MRLQIAARQQRIVIGDQARIARLLHLIVMGEEYGEAILHLVMVEIDTRGVGLDRLGKHRLLFAGARSDHPSNLRIVRPELAAVVQSPNLDHAPLANPHTAPVLLHDFAGVCEAEVILADLLVEEARDQQSLLPRALIGDVRQQRDQALDARVRFVVPPDDSKQIHQSGVGAEPDRLAHLAVGDLTQDRNGRGIVAAIDFVPAMEELKIGALVGRELPPPMLQRVDDGLESGVVRELQSIRLAE